MSDRFGMHADDDCMPCHARILTFSHIPELVKLEADCFPSPWTSREFELCLGQDHFHAWGIVCQKTIIAYLTYFILIDEIEIVNLAVREDRRRCGWGQRLLDDLLHLVQDQGLQRIVLEVRKSNQVARRLYEKNGFMVVGERKRYYPPTGEDALVMAWAPTRT